MKKIGLFTIIILISFFSFSLITEAKSIGNYASNYQVLDGTISEESFCSKSKNVIKYIGKIVYVAKILVPLVIIILGSVDLGKAVVAQKEDEIKSASEMFIKRLIFGVIVFFVPSIVSLIFNLLPADTTGGATESSCAECFLHPYSC